jgi:hypothetical protein
MSESAPITGFQVEVANVFFALPEASSFLLAGGLALLAQGMSVRPTEDMDAFTSNPDDVQRASEAFQSAARSRGWSVEVMRTSETFVRLQVEGSEQILVDLALDSPPGLPSMMSVLGPTFAPDELAARKLLALFGRALPRDFVDVYRVSQSRSTASLFWHAQTLDPGFDSDQLVIAIGQLARYADAQLPIQADEVSTLREFFAQWAEGLAAD